MNAATHTMHTRSILQNTAAVVVFATGLCIQTLGASAADFLTGKSDGLQACVRAVFSSEQVEDVEVHGHRFTCKPMITGDYGDRALHIAHNTPLGLGDNVYVRFTINGLGTMVPESAEAFVSDGLTPVKDVFKLPQEDRVARSSWLARYVSRSYASVANKAKRIRHKKTKSWQQAAGQIAAVAIAELGERTQTSPAESLGGCTTPTFYEGENFRGKRFALGMSVQKLSKLKVDGTRMWNRISSFCVPKGWTVSLFTKDEFKGRSQTFNGLLALPDLGRITVSNGYLADMDNQVRSIRVIRKVSAQQTAQKVQVQ